MLRKSRNFRRKILSNFHLIPVQTLMVVTDVDITAIANVVRTAIAPVFMLTGISSFLAVTSNRLSRIIDRSRVLNQRLRHVKDEKHRAVLLSETRRLLRRTRLISAAILFATSSALLTCFVIITLFLGNILVSHIASIVTLLFITCMLCLSLAFIFFLIEVSFATGFMLTTSQQSAESLIYLSH